LLESRFSQQWLKSAVFEDLTFCLLPASCFFFSCLFFLSYLKPWRWRWRVPMKCWLSLTGPHVIIFQKTELFSFGFVC
jgi:hypothetical protein